MKVTSLTIGGTEMVRASITASPFYGVLFRGFKIDAAVSQKTGTATFIISGKASILSSILIPRSEVIITGADSLRKFGGEMTHIEPTVVNPATGYTEYAISCRDYGYLLDEAIINPSVSYAVGSSDQAAISNILTFLLPAVSAAGVDAVSAIPALSFNNVSVRQALDKICSVTGAQYYVDYSKVLQYFAPTSRAAPFGISDTPNNLSIPAVWDSFNWDGADWNDTSPPTFYALMQGFHCSQEASALYNRITVIGALGSGGAAYTSTKNDLTSQAAYGIHWRVIPDSSIQSTAEADDRALAELAASANPIKAGSFTIRLAGLAVGQVVHVKSAGLNVDDDLLIVGLSSEWKTQDLVYYTVTFGAFLPDQTRLLRKLALDAADPADQPLAVSPPASIVPSQVDHISASSITTGTLDASLITVTNLSASAITTGSMSANRITSGTLDASVVNVTNLNASHIVTGTLTAINITSSSITGSTLVLNLNGVTTSFDNGDPFGFGNGASWLKNSNGDYALVNPGQFRVRDGLTHDSVVITPSGVTYGSSGGDSASMGTFPSSGIKVKIQSVAGPFGQLLVDKVQFGSGSTFYSEVGVSGSDGYAKFNSTYYALWCDANKTRVIPGQGQFVAGVCVVSTSLSSVTSATANPIGGVPSEDIGTGISGGTVTFYSSNTSSTAFFSYAIYGGV